MGCGQSSPQPTFLQVLHGPLVNAKGQSAESWQLLRGKVKLVFFASVEAAYFAQVYLAQFCNDMKAAGKCPFECIFVSCDQSEENYKQLVRLGPWWAVPYLDFKRRAHLSYLFEVNNPPLLLILDEYDNIISTEGIILVKDDFQGEQFPWRGAKLPTLMAPVTLSTVQEERLSGSAFADLQQ